VGAGALLPFPIAHPRDRCARAPLDQTFPKQSHLAHGQGIEVIVEAGAPWLNSAASKNHRGPCFFVLFVLALVFFQVDRIMDLSHKRSFASDRFSDYAMSCHF